MQEAAQPAFKLQVGNPAINEAAVRRLFQEFEDLQGDWPWQADVLDWVDHILSFTGHSHVMAAYLDPQFQGGGQFSLRVDGRIVSGPRFTKSQYEQLQAAIEARVAFTQTQTSEVLREGFLVAAAGRQHWVGFLETAFGVQITFFFETAPLTHKPLADWPDWARAGVEEMLSHPNGLIVCCHRGWSQSPRDTITEVLNALLDKWPNQIRVGCLVESLQSLPPDRATTYLLVDGSEQDWAQAARALVAQDIDVVYIRGRDPTMAVTQAVLTALEDRCVLVDSPHMSALNTLIWLLTELPLSASQVASVLLGVVGSYRGLRQICPNCGVEAVPDESLLSTFKSQTGASIPSGKWMHGQGCEACFGLGYASQQCLTVVEAIYLDKALAELCSSSPDPVQLSSALQERGFRTYFQQALELAQQGITTLHEAMRVGLARRAEL